MDTFYVFSIYYIKYINDRHQWVDGRLDGGGEIGYFVKTVYSRLFKYDMDKATNVFKLFIYININFL